MRALEWFVGFHPRHWHPEGWFGHCEVWGYTMDDTWFFLDPRGREGRLYITHLYDEVTELIAIRHEACHTILKLPPHERTLFPIHGPMTCASVVGHMLGVRAYTPAMLKRKLLAVGAEVIHDSIGKQIGQAGAEA